ncbi:branched-chain amino acid transport system II carrier protein [Miniphocaeibacter halophilus]|uniref:Branched-chain amino acid transport system II carrier protein n=1 Tax=Miniphocaeibacter halophilus TaxID=2931922 RepID=A0AC61MWM7_9FIRM|nr:branched-chain amino acid transport system II carrier protein [Miniphocaeibacter halophilus]QQK07268.1 branched-chain amino acid transport system II carrier protein [Miniphocaeibacter halophilus]
MKNKIKDYITIGSMLFGLFFGAGNLIFPVNLGQNAGANMIQTMIGFLITAVGLPLLGTIAMGISENSSLFEMTTGINKKFGYFFTIGLYLTIGPFFALPRLGTVSFEVGLKSFIGEDKVKVFLLIFTLIFYTLAFLLSLKPSKIMVWVGKVLNPMFLLLLSSLIVVSFVNPMGHISNAEIQSNFISGAFREGFIGGYNTMDVLASLAFSIIVINSIKGLGIKEPNEIAKYTLKSGIVTLVLMSVIYGSLVYMGASSLGKIALSENGGIALNQISKYYFGFFGEILLAIIVVVACLKTAVGLITACSEMFHKIYPKISYFKFICIVTLISFVVSNVGLNSIIKLSLPVLNFLYPIAIVLIALIFLSPIFKNNKKVYIITIIFTAFASLFDALNTVAKSIGDNYILNKILKIVSNILPFFEDGFGWVIPSILGLIVGMFYFKVKGVKNK